MAEKTERRILVDKKVRFFKGELSLKICTNPFEISVVYNRIKIGFPNRKKKGPIMIYNTLPSEVTFSYSYVERENYISS